MDVLSTVDCAECAVADLREDFEPSAVNKAADSDRGGSVGGHGAEVLQGYKEVT